MQPSEKAVEAAHLVERLERLSRTSEGAGILNPAQWDALRYLARANRFSRTPAALAEYLGATRGTVSQTLISLEQRRLIERNRNPRDARSLRLELTQDGLATLAADPLVAMARSFDGAPEGELEAAVAALKSALREVLARNRGRAFGLCGACRHFARAAAPGAAEPHRCRLLDEPLSDRDAGSICAEHAA